jgi:hypothetical protein
MDTTHYYSPWQFPLARMSFYFTVARTSADSSIAALQVVPPDRGVLLAAHPPNPSLALALSRLFENGVRFH